MARDIPFKPRFYIDHLQYLRHSGVLPVWDFNWYPDGAQDTTLQSYMGWRDSYSYNNEGDNYYLNEPGKVRDMFDYNPTKFCRWNYSEDLSGTGHRDNSYQWFWFYSGLDEPSDWEGKWYYACLGHNMYNTNTRLGFRYSSVDVSSGNASVTGQTNYYENSTEIINNCENPHYNGFSINEINSDYKPADPNYRWIDFRLNELEEEALGSTNDLAIGTISFGKIFDLSISSDLKMTMGYEYGTKGKESRSGTYLSSVEWWQKPLWANLPAWELDQDRYSDDAIDRKKNSNSWRKSGRRVYNLSFSFLTSDELLVTSGVLDGTTMAGNLFEGDSSGDLTDEREDGTKPNVHDSSNPINIMNDNSFFAQVVHKTMGFHLPFIFQPNSDYCKPDGFMLARVDSRSGFKLSQIAPDLWKCNLVIKEIW